MEYVKLGDICTKVCSGGTPTSSNPAYYDGNIPWLNTNEVNFCNIYSTNKTISEEGLKKSAAKYVPENTVIVAMYGVTAGKCAIAKIPLTTNQACCNLIIDKEKADYCYVYYYLRQQSDSLNKLAIGGAQQNLNALTIKKFKIALPTLPTQQKIASILSAYDRLIENNTRRIRLLEQMAENLYKEWFVRFRFPEHEKVEMINGLPKGWRAIHIKELAQLKSGYAFKSEWFIEEGEAVAKIKDIGNILMDTSSFSYVDKENCIKAKKFLLTTGDLTIALTGATIGKISIVPKHKGNIYTNQRLGKFFLGDKPMEKLPFLYCLFKQESMVSNIVNLSNSSSAQPNISPEQIEKIKILGNHDIISMYNKTCNPLFSNILALYSQNQLLTRQRDLLLPRLMSGKLEVKS
jgi:type I restriction modification DNA specificity domain protein